MLEQSDVSCGDRLWRSILVEASSPQVCRRAALELRHRFAPGGLVVSTPGFVRMLACTEARGAARPRAGGEAAAPTRYVLSDVLLQQWRQGKEGYTPRVWRDAQDRETAPHALPLPGADLLLESRMQLPYLRAGGPLRSAASEATPPVQAAEGTLDMFPESVVKATLTDAASRGDEQLLRQLLSLDGIRVDCRCGREANVLDTPLHVAARAGNTAIVRQLLRSHADISILANGGRTPLHTAALGGSAAHADCVRLFLRYGCDPLATDVQGLTASDLAEMCRHTEGKEDCARLLFPYSRKRYCRREHGEASPKPFMSSLLAGEVSAPIAARMPRAMST